MYRYGNNLKDAPIYIKADRDLVLSAVKQTGLNLQFADELLKKDRSIVLVALCRTVSA